MKKVFKSAFCILTIFILISCHSEPQKVKKWFDSFHGDNTISDYDEYILDEFPDVIFRCDSEKLDAVTDKEVITLYNGFPISSVYFCDLNGDGNREICSTVCVGFGMIDVRIIAYDYANAASYELSARGKYDYILNMKDDSLVVEKRAYNQDNLVSTGRLTLENDTLKIVAD